MNDRWIGKNLAPGVMALVVLALAWMLLYAPALQADAAASTPTVAVEADTDLGAATRVERIKTRPAPGMTCTYTCEGSSASWTLECASNNEEECEGIADAVCPTLVPGSTGTSSFSC